MSADLLLVKKKMKLVKKSGITGWNNRGVISVVWWTAGVVLVKIHRRPAGKAPSSVIRR